ncbi:helix-turn-helix domain-containing protein [Gordonia sp. NPDC003376]
MGLDAARPTRVSGPGDLPDVLLCRPVVDSNVVAHELGIDPKNAHRVITPLLDAGILDEVTGFDRNRMWQAIEVTGALDAFAERAARRGR